jgi:hypothetical protein
LLCVKYFIEVTQGILDPQILNAFVFMPGDSPTCRWQKGGDRYMKYFKITRTWVVKAEDEPTAFKLVSSDPSKYLDSETVTRTEYKKPQPKTGWGQTIKSQLLGSNSKR